MHLMVIVCVCVHVWCGDMVCAFVLVMWERVAPQREAIMVQDS